jgi:hypothetical protein
VSVKASTVSRDLSKATLQRRLGPFEATQPTQMSAQLVQPERMPKKSPNRTPDMERIAGVESLVGWIQRGCADALRQACNWAEVHEVAQRNGLRVQLRGNGLVFVAAQGLAVKASFVSRDLSKLALERRLGRFEATGFSDHVALTQCRRGPMPLQKSDARLYERYLQDRAAALDRRNHAVGQLREDVLTYGIGVVTPVHSKAGVRYRVRIPDGDGGYKSLGVYDTHEEAERMRDAGLVAAADVETLSGITLYAYGERWLSRCAKAVMRDVGSMRSRWKTIVANAPFAQHSIEAVTRAHVRDWARTLTQQSGKRSVARAGKRTTVETGRTLSWASAQARAWDGRTSPRRGARGRPRA